MRTKFWGSALAAMVFLVSPAGAVEWGVQATASVSDILQGGGQTNPSIVARGGAGIPFADALIDDSSSPVPGPGTGPHNRGIAHGFAGLQFAANTPAALRAEGILTGNTSGVPHLGQFPNGAVVDASSFASDIFQYTGSTPTTLSISFTLEGIVSENPVDPTGITGLYARMAVLADTPNYQFLPFLDTLVFELGATLIDTESMQITEDTAGGLAMRTATLDVFVNPGDTFYVWQKLNVAAVRGTRFADAFNTLTSTFSEPQNVRSLSAPEPASLVLVAIAGISIVMARREHQFA